MSTSSGPLRTVVRASTQEEADELIAAGGRLRRCAHEMSRDLDETDGPPLPPVGVQIQPLGRPAETIAVAAALATPPGHPDHEAWSNPLERIAYWRRLLQGTGPGVLLPQPSGLLVDTANNIVGAIAVTMLNTVWWGQEPWIAEVFVVPDRQGQGLGGFLIRRALGVCQALGHGRIGLTVTEGNRAEDLYRRLGFQRFRTGWMIER